MYQLSVSKLCDWLVAQRTDPELIHLLCQYLLSRGSRPMSSICRHYSPYRHLTEMQDILGFQNLIEGRISSLYLVPLVVNLVNMPHTGAMGSFFTFSR